MTIRQTKIEELDKVLEFYKTCSYSGGATQDDLIICAEMDNIIVAVVRLCNENQTLVLRGMQVDKQFQRQGIGKKLLSRLDKIIDTQTCYCIPYGHLEKFYSSIGFKKVDSNKIPDHLFKRLCKYSLKYPNMLIMKKQHHA